MPYEQGVLSALFVQALEFQSFYWSDHHDQEAAFVALKTAFNHLFQVFYRTIEIPREKKRALKDFRM